MNSHKKPYIKKQPANWYQENRFFGLYMLRELTAIPVALEAVNLFAGLASLAKELSAWQAWLSAQTHPAMILFHLIVIIASLYHSATWFSAMPKAIRIQQGEKFVPDKLLIGGSWATLVGVFAVLVGLVIYFSK